MGPPLPHFRYGVSSWYGPVVNLARSGLGSQSEARTVSPNRQPLWTICTKDSALGNSPSASDSSDKQSLAPHFEANCTRTSTPYINVLFGNDSSMTPTVMMAQTWSRHAPYFIQEILFQRPTVSAAYPPLLCRHRTFIFVSVDKRIPPSHGPTRRSDQPSR